MKRDNHKIGFSLLALMGLSLLLLSFGCKAENKGPNEPVVTKRITTSTSAKKSSAKPEVKKASAPTGQPTSAPPAMETARLPYDPTGKVDPFRPLFKEESKPKVDKKTAPKRPERPRTPLERLDLGQLRLTAVIFSETRPRAMVEEDNGKGYVIQIGTHIGLERGQVTDIKRDRIVIEHTKTDDFGNAAMRRRELKLQKPPGD